MRATPLLLSATLFSLLAITALPAAMAADATRQAEVATRGAQVMPFDLAATTHVFTKTSYGGVQQVTVRNPADTKQIRLTRTHLKGIAAQFRRGDFSGPTDIHGAAMPGLAELKSARSGEIDVSYQDIPSGGEIRYSTKNDHWVEALHQWFDAQLSDHGAHAMEGHVHPGMDH
ncbi:aspartate carbamoyltransferase [Pandoraea commovens]|uniref:Aspartate carbamoyltransferase n=1 Tax=Pandoraea commovens TaxID=2508289 RepID=A0ABY5QMA9_9BURK|nr:aspartate carbamoyltransferase [Pandoraea commovens]UVA81941.1 aspartate carbamoyltransferase [Pandoraea commovens]